MQLHLFAALAEFERELIRERSQAGRDVARSGGHQRRPSEGHYPEKLAAAVAMRAQKELTMAQIARTLSVGRSTHYEHRERVATESPSVKVAQDRWRAVIPSACRSLWRVPEPPETAAAAPPLSAADRAI